MAMDLHCKFEETDATFFANMNTSVQMWHSMQCSIAID